MNTQQLSDPPAATPPVATFSPGAILALAGAGLLLATLTVAIIVQQPRPVRPRSPRPIVTQPNKPLGPVFPIAPPGTPDETLSPAAASLTDGSYTAVGVLTGPGQILRGASYHTDYHPADTQQGCGLTASAASVPIPMDVKVYAARTITVPPSTVSMEFYGGCTWVRVS
jgi:hypothetical protein